MLVCALSTAASSPAPAAGRSATQAINDCNDNGRLTQRYSPVVLRQALAQMPADVKEYTDCFDVIERQLFAQLGTSDSVGAAGSSDSGSSSLPTWLLILIVLLALAAVTFGALALRRRTAPAADAEDARPDGLHDPPDPGAPPPGRARGGADDQGAPRPPDHGRGADDPAARGPAGPGTDAGA